MSAGWTAGSPTSAYGTRTTDSSRTSRAHQSVLEANCVGRSTVHAIPLARSRRSTARFARAGTKVWMGLDGDGGDQHHVFHPGVPGGVQNSGVIADA